MKVPKIGIVCPHHKLIGVPLLSISFDPIKFFILGEMACGCGLMMYRDKEDDIIGEVIKRKPNKKKNA